MRPAAVCARWCALAACWLALARATQPPAPAPPNTPPGLRPAAPSAPDDLLAPALRLGDALRVLGVPDNVLPQSPQGVEHVVAALTGGGGAAVPPPSPQSVEVAQAALSALARLTDDQPPGADGGAPLLVAAAVEGGALGGVAGALRAHGGGSAPLAGAACAAAYALGRHAVAHHHAAQAGLVALVHGALVTHGADGEVAAMCAHALMHLTVDTANKRAFGELGPSGPDALIAALKRHASSVRVARCVSGAMNNCAAGSADNKKAVVAAGGMEALTASLLAHRRDAQAAEQSCGALAVLAMGKGGPQRATKAGAIDAAVAVLEVHSGQRRPKAGTGRQAVAPSARVVAACGRALASIAWADPDAQRAARDAMAPEALRAAQKAFPDDTHVQKWTAKALEKISDPMVESMFEGLLSGDLGKAEL